MIRNCDRDIPVFLITAYPDLMKREGPVCHPIVTKRKTWDHRATKLCDAPRVGHLAQIRATGVGKCMLFASSAPCSHEDKR